MTKKLSPSSRSLTEVGEQTRDSPGEELSRLWEEHLWRP